MSKHETLPGSGVLGADDPTGLLRIATGNMVHSALGSCICCGDDSIFKICEFCEFDIKRWGYPIFEKGNEEAKVIFDTPLKLDGIYSQSHEVLGEQKNENALVYQLGYEIYQGVSILILGIHRNKPWVHKGRKIIDGKPSEIETFTPKISKKIQNVRIEFNPNNLVESEIVAYGGTKKNGNIIPVQEIDYSQLLEFVKEASFGEN